MVHGYCRILVFLAFFCLFMNPALAHGPCPCNDTDSRVLELTEPPLRAWTSVISSCAWPRWVITSVP